jgi:phosphatidylserine decarboxylase
MSQVEFVPTPSQPEPLPANLSSIQPGGGVCYRLELAWGRLRRWYLKRFRARYVARMASLRQGSALGCPHEVLDPRDLKYHRNQCDCFWEPQADPFRWRDRIPFARWGLAELQLLGWPLFALTIGLTWFRWYLFPIGAVPLALLVYFFRDPARHIPLGPGLVVSPADGTIAEIETVSYDPFIDGPAIRLGIFLSIFNVHVNRAPLYCRVLRLVYNPGEFRNALDPASAGVNENMWLGCEEAAPPYRRFSVRQIAGAIARRIVCDVRPGEVLQRGQKFGMIKLGSRTELVLPAEDGLSIDVKVGDKVAAGSTILAHFVGNQTST